MMRIVAHSPEVTDGRLAFPAALPLRELVGVWPTSQSPWLGVWSAWDPRSAPALEPGMNDAELAAVLLRYARHHHADLPRVDVLADLPGAVQEALASEWSRWFFSRLLIPQLSLLVMSARLLPLESPALRVGADGVVEGFWLSHGGSTLASVWPLAASEREALSASLLWLLEQALLPWIRRLERVAGCRARILWGNAASYWRWWLESEPLLTRLASLTATEATRAEQRRQTALQFIEQRDLPSSSIYGASAQCSVVRNPLYQPLRLRQSDGLPILVRPVCCQRHRLPHLALCPSCPLTPATVRCSGVSS